MICRSIGIDTKEKAIRQFYFDPNRREPLGITDVEMYRICDTFSRIIFLNMELRANKKFT